MNERSESKHFGQMNKQKRMNVKWHVDVRTTKGANVSKEVKNCARWKNTSYEAKGQKDE